MRGSALSLEEEDVMTDGHSMAGRVAVVTGAGGGIGSATCRALAESGASVVLTYRRSEDQTRAVMESLPGADHLLLRVDVTDSAAVRLMADKVARRYGTLDLLVNNAGFTRFVPHDNLDALDDELIDTIFQVNWRGPFACVRALRPLLARGEGGLVVNITSVAGIFGMGSNVAYCASKAALHMMTVSLARALAPEIRVMSVAPGLVEGKYADQLDPQWVKEQGTRTPLSRLVQAEDVAQAVLALATLLTFSTGSLITVDGGRLLV
jgi:3-oxoacyl-[acyl-carrier protein] reductase